MARYYVMRGPRLDAVSNQGFAGLVGACVDARERAVAEPNVEHVAVRYEPDGDVIEARYTMRAGKLKAWVR